MKNALLLALFLSFVFLYGCTDKVDTQQYQKAVSERDSYQRQLEDLRLQIPIYESKAAAAEKNYADCLSQKIEASSEASACKGELAAATSASDSRGAYISKVKASTAKYDTYARLLADYYVLFNSSTVPTYSKIVEYEQKINAANDAPLMQKWKSALNCPANAVCTPLWNSYLSHIKDRMAEGATLIYSAIKGN